MNKNIMGVILLIWFTSGCASWTKIHKEVEKEEAQICAGVSDKKECTNRMGDVLWSRLMGVYTMADYGAVANRCNAYPTACTFANVEQWVVDSDTAARFQRLGRGMSNYSRSNTTPPAQMLRPIGPTTINCTSREMLPGQVHTSCQ